MNCNYRLNYQELKMKSFFNLKQTTINRMILTIVTTFILLAISGCDSNNNKNNTVEQSRDTTSQGAINLAKISDEQKMEQQRYFTEHSFEFSSLFKKYHPGPHWIIAHAQEFQLTEEQRKQQQELNNGMAKETIMANTALKSAYKTYEADAAMEEPSLEVLNNDIEAIGKAQTHLAQVMIPFHLKSYEILNPSQKAIYKKLAAEQ